jgi:hypothetical protein
MMTVLETMNDAMLVTVNDGSAGEDDDRVETVNGDVLGTVNDDGTGDWE